MPKKESAPQPYVLGLDLGAQSLGWHCLKANGILACGARVFEAGVEGDIKSGRDESRAIKRRMARLARRGLARRARRQAKLFNLLQRHGLLPGAFPCSPTQRDELIKKLDAALAAARASSPSLVLTSRT